jgi:hypothetical protein
MSGLFETDSIWSQPSRVSRRVQDEWEIEEEQFHTVNAYAETTWIILVLYIIIQTVLNTITVVSFRPRATGLQGRRYNLQQLHSLEAEHLEGTLTTPVQEGITGMGPLVRHLSMGFQDLQQVDIVEAKEVYGTLYTPLQDYVQVVGTFRAALDCGGHSVVGVTDLTADVVAATVLTHAQPMVTEIGPQEAPMDLDGHNILGVAQLVGGTVTSDTRLTVASQQLITSMGPQSVDLDMGHQAIHNVSDLEVLSPCTWTLSEPEAATNSQHFLLHFQQAGLSDESLESVLMWQSSATTGDVATLRQSGLYAVVCRYCVLPAAMMLTNQSLVGFLLKNVTDVSQTPAQFAANDQFIQFGMWNPSDLLYGVLPLGTWIGHLSEGDTLSFLLATSTVATGPFTTPIPVTPIAMGIEICFIR